MKRTYWHKHPRNFANECCMVYATTKAQREEMKDLGYERLSLKEVHAEIRYVNAENDSWGSNRAFGVMRLADLNEHCSE